MNAAQFEESLTPEQAAALVLVKRSVYLFGRANEADHIGVRNEVNPCWHIMGMTERSVARRAASEELFKMPAVPRVVMVEGVQYRVHPSTSVLEEFIPKLGWYTSFLWRDVRTEVTHAEGRQRLRVVLDLLDNPNEPAA